MKKILFQGLLWMICLIPTRGWLQNEGHFKPQQVYATPTLVIQQITPGCYVHTSYKQTQDFGYVPCNGMVIIKGNEALVFDTPTHDSASVELIKWLQETRQCNILGVVPTHFHDDCLGGLQAFHMAGIPSYAHHKTIQLADENNEVVPQIGFNDSLLLQVGGDYVVITFFGEGHTSDNVVAYYAQEEVLFGGCLIKELHASKGYLGDANVAQWSATVEKIKQHYKRLKWVVPGHGKYGNKKLLDYTMKLFRTK